MVWLSIGRGIGYHSLINNKDKDHYENGCIVHLWYPFKHLAKARLSIQNISPNSLSNHLIPLYMVHIPVLCFHGTLVLLLFGF